MCPRSLLHEGKAKGKREAGEKEKKGSKRAGREGERKGMKRAGIKRMLPQG